MAIPIRHSPNCSNVISEKVIFTVEVREKREERIQRAVKEIEEAVVRISEQSGTTCEIRSIADSKPFRMDERLIKLTDKLAAEAGIGHQIMDSGAQLLLNAVLII